MRKILFPAIAITGLLGSCSKEKDTVSPGTDHSGMTYELRAANNSASISQRTTAGGTVVWNSGYAYPKEIKFEAKSQNDKIEYKSRNTGRIDLFAPSPMGFGSFVLPPGTYKEIELKIKLEDDGPDPALQLNGTYSDNQGSIPVVFIIDGDVQLKTELKDVTVTDGSFAALTTLDLATYTGGITESMFRNAQRTNGTIVISRTSNRNLYDIMLRNFTDKRHKCEFRKKQ
jgi:hypothetical protein